MLTLIDTKPRQRRHPHRPRHHQVGLNTLGGVEPLLQNGHFWYRAGFRLSLHPRGAELLHLACGDIGAEVAPEKFQ